MLTKVFDLVRSMCSKYWPDEIDSTDYYAPIEVTLLGEESLAEFTMRTFRLRKRFMVKSGKSLSPETLLVEKTMKQLSLQDEEERIVYQFQYFSWPIHSQPSIDSILHFRRRVRVVWEEVASSLREEGKVPGPLVVHCSDGCGRTGAFLAIDANMENAEEDNCYDIFGYTRKMRSAKKGMIDTPLQYR
jgi:protein tyrosine phosphatase